jgi:hypothetical protein
MAGALAKCTDLQDFEAPIGETISDIVKLKLIIGGIIAGIGFVSSWAGFAVVSLAMIAAAAGPGLILLTGLYKAIKLLCRPGPSGIPDQCLSGVVVALTPSFDNSMQTWFPMTARHDRVDLVVVSTAWPIVEYSNAEVFCTQTDDLERRSEIFRCYFYDPRVCEAARRAWEGAAVGAVLGLVIGAIVGVLLCGIGLCFLGIIVAALISTTLTSAGAAIGSKIGQHSSDDLEPAGESGEAIAVGNLVTARGNLVQSGVDGGANVFWWVDEAYISGSASPSIPDDPYSHCEIDLEFGGMDSCIERPVVE